MDIREISDDTKQMLHKNLVNMVLFEDEANYIHFSGVLIFLNSSFDNSIELLHNSEDIRNSTGDTMRISELSRHHVELNYPEFENDYIFSTIPSKNFENFHIVGYNFQLLNKTLKTQKYKRTI